MIRSEGAMRGMITGENLSDKKLLEKVLASPSMNGLDLCQKVTTSKSYSLTSNISKKSKFRIAIYDYGIKRNILREFLEI